MLKFTESEINYLQSHPKAYKLLNDYHESQICEAESTGDPSSIAKHHIVRIKQLKTIKLKLEIELGWDRLCKN